MAVERNLILCAVQTPYENQNIPTQNIVLALSVITGLLLLYVYCMSNVRYMSCSSWLWKASLGVPKLKDSFPYSHSGGCKRPSDKCWSVDVWRRRIWRKWIHSLGLVLFGTWTGDLHKESMGFSTGAQRDVNKHSTAVSVLMYFMEISHLPDVTLCEALIFLL